MKVVALVVVAALAAAAYLAPPVPSPAADDAEPVRPSPFAVCPAAEAARRSSEVFVLGGDGGELGLTVFSGGSSIATTTESMGAGSGVGVLVNDLTGVAAAPVLAALPDAAASTELVLSAAGEAALACDGGSAEVVVLPGGSTNGDDTFTVALANPFAGSALVDIGAASEVGTETNAALEGIVVPPRSVVIVDLEALLPGRLGMSAWVVATRGRVVVAGLQEGPGDLGAVHGLEPAMDWFVPLPRPTDIAIEVVIANPTTADVAFQFDTYSDTEVIEAAYENVVPARGHLAIPADEIMEGPGGLRLLATAEVAVSLRLVGDVGRAIVPGVTAPSDTWQLPGVGALGTTQLSLFNTGDFDLTAEIVSADDQSVIATVDVPAGHTVATNVDQAGAGVTVRSDGDLVVMWLTRTANGISGDAGRVPPS